MLRLCVRLSSGTVIPFVCLYNVRNGFFFLSFGMETNWMWYDLWSWPVNYNKVIINARIQINKRCVDYCKSVESFYSVDIVRWKKIKFISRTCGTWIPINFYDRFDYKLILWIDDNLHWFVTRRSTAFVKFDYLVTVRWKEKRWKVPRRNNEIIYR